MRSADHVEQRWRLRLAVDHPSGVENLVPAVLGVGLREHHQFDVARVAPHPANEQPDKIVDLVIRQGQTQAPIGLDQRLTPTAEQINPAQRRRREMLEEPGGLRKISEHGFGHAIMQQGRHPRPIGIRHALEAVGDAALDAFNRRQAAIPCNFRRLRRPRRNRADTRRHEKQLTVRGRFSRTLLEQGRQPVALGGAQGFAQKDEVPEFRAKHTRRRHKRPDLPSQCLKTKSRNSRITAQKQGFGHDDFRAREKRTGRLRRLS